MKDASRSDLGMFCVGAALIMGALLFGGRPAAKESSKAAAGRFQVAAYTDHPDADSSGHGCYILDTETGELWHSRNGGKAEKVCDDIR